MKTICLSLVAFIALCITSSCDEKELNYGSHPVVLMKTSMGSIEITLDAEKAPITVENFLSYMNEAFYDSTLFHRVINGFVIQGGGFTENGTRKPIKTPIKCEAANGLKNKRGTIVMARTNELDSATSQFFINLKDNRDLDHNNRSYGYAVFGVVTNGMDVVDSIAGLKIHNLGGAFMTTPVNPVIIESVRIKE